MKLIAIAGSPPAGSGKDTVAGILAEQHGLPVIGFADPMKWLCERVFGWSRDRLFGRSELRNAPDLAFAPDGTRLNLRWCGAFAELEDVGPGWLDDLRLTRDAMGPLRGWFLSLMLGTIGVEWSTGNAITPVQFSARIALQRLGTEFGRQQRPSLWIEYALRRITESREDGAIIADARFQNERTSVRLNGGKVVLVTRPMPGLAGVAGSHASENDLADGDFDAVIRNTGTLEQLRSTTLEIGRDLLGVPVSKKTLDVNARAEV